MDNPTPIPGGETDKTLRQRAAELAHELSQPLYAITNFTEACLALLARPGDVDKAELTQLLTQIGQQARRGGDILRRFSHGDSADVRPEDSFNAEPKA